MLNQQKTRIAFHFYQHLCVESFVHTQTRVCLCVRESERERECICAMRWKSRAGMSLKVA